MKYDFNKYMDRRGTDCEKWDGLKDDFGRGDLLAMWVADMDFPAPPEVLEAIHKKVDEGALGYPMIPDSLRDTVRAWEKEHYGWEFGREAVSWAPGVVAGLSFAVMGLTKPGDQIIIQTPVYMPFYRTVREAGRIIAKNPLKYENGRYTMDFEGLEKLITPTCRTLILCSPHNPVARVWSREELERLADIAIRKNMIIISDEIHQDLVYSDAKHICIGSLPGMAERTVTFIAPSKTFNIAGMKASVAIIPDELLRGIYVSVLERFHLNSINILGITAMEAAYGKCGEWHRELVPHLEGNRDYMEAFVKERMPKAHMDHPEGTYIFWIDFRGYGFNDETLTDFLVNEAKVALDPGTWFGVEGDGFARLNIGTTRAMLKEGLERIAGALDIRENKKIG
ncbi:MalY/PatB family protein [Cloacibacillus evryensis]|uniref:MalY/PatB family protein n=1 Tax=Cloacibacillus evryensis TaxID=508460 RepID=UPI00044E2D04|nr:MalY/PatB family protein [Cloacibacillus evryensis]EXG78475.1 bifunctional PLP-dependent enzyme with beta-cystathionase and maltose regulon repressor activities [Cloacibacillus evryensis DSM 19522]